MGAFSRAEIEHAVGHYTTVVEGCSESGDWRPFADLFTEDVVYTEHHYGVFHGREAVREWIVAVMAPFPHMRFPSDWIAYDDENDAVVIMIKNLLDHPTDTDGVVLVVVGDPVGG
ncbi:MAG: nuclear transport factor 2 family protein, partial [Mycobacterium sp.]